MDTMQPTVSLAETPQIPAAYKEAITKFLREHWERRRWEMQESFGFHNLPLLTDEQLLRTLLADGLAEIARCATGQMNGDRDALAIVYEAVQALMEQLFAIPGLYSYEIPAAFWDTELGQMVAVALLHIRGDELITITEAAEIRGVTAQAISQAIDAGRLTGYVDPAAPKRQGRRLVSRREVESL